MATRARNAFARSGVEAPFARTWGEGNRWIGTGDPPIRSTPSLTICPGCGYNLRPETPVASGPFTHDPASGIATIHGVPMRGHSQLHALIGTFMRSGGTVLKSDVVADRLGSESDDPARMVSTLVCLLRRSCRHHGVELPVRNIVGLGYAWSEASDTRTGAYMGPPVPSRIRLGTPTGPDLSSALVHPPLGEHSCGCALGAPSISSEGWTWHPEDGLRHAGISIATGAKAKVAANVMAASGRYVHAAIDLKHVIGGDPSNAGDHLNVIICRLRSAAADAGTSIPIEARNGHGVRWTGSAPTLHMPDAEEDCPKCLGRSARMSRLGMCAIRPPRHPGSLSGGALLLADLLSSCDGRTVTTSEALSLLDSNGDGRLAKVYVSRIRRAYREAGLPDPISNVRGVGYRWTGDSAVTSGIAEPPEDPRMLPSGPTPPTMTSDETLRQVLRSRENERDRRAASLPVSGSQGAIRMLRLSHDSIRVMAARRRSRRR